MSSLNNISFSHEQYIPVAEIGRGGMGIVYRCTDRKMLRDVAVKVIGWNLANEEIIRFHEEAKALARLQHPNILAILHFGHSEDDSLFLVTELLTGRSLSALLEAEKFPPFEDALEIFIQICDGLAHAHNKDTLHRDIKPSNIFVERTANGAIKVTITDFGLAKLLTEDQRLTKTGIMVGTPAYMSPEQVDGKPVDERADIYSMGCLMYEVLSGEKPFDAPNIQALLMKQKNDPPPKLSETFADRNYPEEMDRIISKCMAKEVDGRYSKVQELRHALKALKDSLLPQITAADPSGRYNHMVSRTGAFLRTGVQALGSSSKQAKIVLAVVIGIAAVSLGGWIVLFHEDPVVDTKLPDDSVSTEELNKAANPYLKTTTKPRDADDKIWAHCIGAGGSAKLLELSANAKATMARDGAHPEYVDLTSSDVTDEQLRLIESIPLRGIRLIKTGITDDGMKSLSKISTLQEIYLDDTKVSDAGIRLLRQNEKLDTIALSKTAVSDATITTLSGLPRLKWVTFYGCKNVTGATLGDLRNARNLWVLSLANSAMKRENIGKLINTTVSYLDLSGLQLTDADLITVSRIPRLNTLMINDNPDVTTAGFMKLTTIKNLGMLHVGNCPGIDVNSYHEFQRRHPSPPVMIWNTGLRLKNEPSQ